MLTRLPKPINLSKKMLAMKRPKETPRIKSANLSTKIEPLPGAVDARFLRCGKPNCKCAKGDLHGPYFVYRVRMYGQRRSKYVKKADVLAVKLAVEAGRAERKRVRQELREAIRTLRRFRYGLLDLLR